MAPVKNETRLNSISEFLAKKRIALVGVSRKPRHYSRGLLKEFRKRGIEVACVNPSATEIDGQPCAARIRDVQPAVDAALIAVPFTELEAMARECVDAGIKAVWIPLSKNGKKVEPGLLEYFKANGVDVIHDHCPHMFLSRPGFPHNLHGFVLKLAKSYPA